MNGFTKVILIYERFHQKPLYSVLIHSLLFALILSTVTVGIFNSTSKVMEGDGVVIVCIFIDIEIERLVTISVMATGEMATGMFGGI